ncbi:MAG: hypothetical protein IJK41_09025 [Muribaculaceae bacterium]|nr:hypothetical protein [Muribaculaceae bacterium]
MNKNYQHSNELEERYFCMDIAALKLFDNGFKTAYDCGSGYELTIKLIDLFVICPRKRQRKQQYKRFVKYLATRGITLKIISRKRDKTITNYDN